MLFIHIRPALVYTLRFFSWKLSKIKKRIPLEKMSPWSEEIIKKNILNFLAVEAI